MYGFGLMNAIFPILFFLVFAIIVGAFIVMAVKGVSQWGKNNASPVLTVEAEIVTKRENVSRHTNMHGDTHHHHTSTSYYATFQVESGDRMELHISGQDYGMLAEGDRGKLTFQGTRYLGFERGREADKTY